MKKVRFSVAATYAAIYVLAWTAISAVDFTLTLNSNIFNHQLISTTYNLSVPVAVSAVLALKHRCAHHLWWIPLPVWGGVEDVLCIAMQTHAGFIIPPIYYWLEGNVAIRIVKTLLGHAFITHDTIVSSTIFYISVSLTLSTLIELVKVRRLEKTVQKKNHTTKADAKQTNRPSHAPVLR